MGKWWRRWRQRRIGTRSEILPPQMCRNCIPPTRAWCRNLWIEKEATAAEIYCTFLSRHNKEKGNASLSICQVCRSFHYCLLGHFDIVIKWKRRKFLFCLLYIFHHVLDPLLPPPVVHYTLYPPPPSGTSSKYLQIWVASSHTTRWFENHQESFRISYKCY